MLKYFLFFICIGGALAQSEPNLGDLLAYIPPELYGKDDEKQINEIGNKAVQAFQKKCEENGGLDAFQKADTGLHNFRKCIRSLINPATVKKEIEMAKTTGQVDEVLKKYCYKPQFKSCFHNMIEAIKSCFSLEEQDNLKTIYNISEQLAEFVCYKERDRMALFIYENGPECINNKQGEIEACLEQTLGTDAIVNQQNFSLSELPKIQFGDTECNQFPELQKCVVSSLETCSAPSSARIVESLFKVFRKATPCKSIQEKGNPNNSANTLALKSVAMVAILFSLVV